MASTAKDRAPSSETARSTPSEAELDSPSRQTLWLLGIMAGATLVMWVLGRVACNYHVPGESLTPRSLTVEERSKSIKDAAIEFARSVESGDFAAARLVASGSAQSSLDALEKSCSDCQARAASKKALRVVGVVQRENGKEGYVTVTVQGGARGEQKSLLHVSRGAKSFQVDEVLPLDAPLPKLARPEPKLDVKAGSPVPPLLRRPSEAAPGAPALSTPSTPAPAGTAVPVSPTKPPGHP